MFSSFLTSSSINEILSEILFYYSDVAYKTDYYHLFLNVLINKFHTVSVEFLSKITHPTFEMSQIKRIFNVVFKIVTKFNKTKETYSDTTIYTLFTTMPSHLLNNFFVFFLKDEPEVEKLARTKYVTRFMPNKKRIAALRKSLKENISKEAIFTTDMMVHNNFSLNSFLGFYVYFNSRLAKWKKKLINVEQNVTCRMCEMSLDVKLLCEHTYECLEKLSAKYELHNLRCFLKEIDKKANKLKLSINK